MALTDKLKAIADAIRAKTGSTDSMTLEQMPTEISNISTGSSVEEPYIKETYDASGNVISINFVVHTNIRSHVCYRCTKLTSVTMPDNISQIGNDAFNTCAELENIKLPKNLKKLRNSVFSNCAKLNNIELPDGIEYFGSSVFSYCYAITTFTFPSSVKYISAYMFSGCGKLTSITLNCKPVTLATNAFNGCDNLTNINVPWSEGEVSGAPWGATKATINYNYTGE